MRLHSQLPWGAQHGKLERVEPVVSDGLARFRHQALPVPGQSQPEPAVDLLPFQQRDAADQLLWFRFQSKRPMPLVSASHRGEGYIPIVGAGAVWRIGPGNAFREIANDLPMRKQELRLLRIGELQGKQQETRSLQRGDHASRMIKQTILKRLLWNPPSPPIRHTMGHSRARRTCLPFTANQSYDFRK